MASPQGAVGGQEEPHQQKTQMDQMMELLTKISSKMETGQSQVVSAVKKLATNSNLVEDTLDAMQTNIATGPVFQGRPAFFQGKTNENPVDFLRAMENFASLHRFGDAKKIDTFKVCLGTKPARWFEKNIEDNSTWADIKQAFLSEYGAAKKSYLQKKNLTDRKWSPGESLETFVDDITERFELVQPLEEIKLEKFLDGLPGKYRAKVLEAEPTTFDEAVKQAFKARSVFSANDESDIDARPYNDVKLAAQLKLITEAIHELKTSQEQLKVLNVVQKPPNPTVKDICRQCGEAHSVLNCPYPGPVCFKCKDPSHRSRNCPKFIQQPRTPQTCTYCSRKGHVEHQCRTKQRNATICQLCSRPGHTAPVCRQQQRQPQQQQGRDNTNCAICGLPGHLAIGCLYNQNRQQQHMGNQQMPGPFMPNTNAQFNPSNQGNQ